MKSTISLHITKCDTYRLSGRQRHNERIGNHSNKNIDLSKSDLNVTLKACEGTYREAIDKILSEGYKGKRAIRKDAVRMLEITVQLGGDYGGDGDATMEDKNKALMEAYRLLSEKYGEKNIVSAIIHNDETNPHMHFDVVPLTADGKLSAKTILGNASDMRKMHKEFLENMQKAVPQAGFDRKGDQTLNGLEQKVYEKITNKIKKRETDVLLKEVFADNELKRLERWEKKLEKAEKELQDKDENLNRSILDFKEKEDRLAQEQETLRREREALREEIARERDELDDKKANIDFERTELNKSILGFNKEKEEVSKQKEENKARASEVDKRILGYNSAVAKYREDKAKLDKSKLDFENEKSRVEDEQQAVITHIQNQLAQVQEQRQELDEFTARIDRALENVPAFNSKLIKWAEAQPVERKENVERLVNMAYRQGVTEPIREIRQSRETPQVVERSVRRLEKATSLPRDNMDKMLDDMLSGDLEDFGKAVDLLDEDKGFYL